MLVVKVVPAGGGKVTRKFDKKRIFDGEDEELVFRRADVDIFRDKLLARTEADKFNFF